MRSSLALAALVMLAAPAAAQAPLAPLDWLVGSWSGEGTRFGNPTRATLAVRPALGGRFIELHYVSEGFEGRAFYRPLEGARWRGEWFDNRGVHFGILANVEGRQLTADWGEAAGERGRTTYRLREDGRLDLIDTVAAADGTHREFARHVLARAD